MFLNLPVLSPEVPETIEFGSPSPLLLRLALAMSQAEMISDDDLAPLSEGAVSSLQLRSLVESAWKRCLGDRFDFEILSAYVHLVLPDKSDGFFYDESGDLKVGFVLDASNPDSVCFGRIYEALEAKERGLGCKVLQVLDGTLCAFGVPCTPSGAFEMAKYVYWQGEDSEQEAIEIFGEEYEDAYGEIVRRDEVFAGVPEVVYLLPEAMVNPAELESLADRFCGCPLGKLLSLVSGLAKLNQAPVLIPLGYDDYDCSMSFSPPVIINWNSDNNGLSRVFDDYFNSANQCGESAPWVGAVVFDPTIEGIKESMPLICHTANVLKALDEVLIEIRRLENELCGC